MNLPLIVYMSLDKYINNLDSLVSERVSGKVTNVVGLTIESKGPMASIGEICKIISHDGKTKGKAEVVGFKNNSLILMPLGDITDITLGDSVIQEAKYFSAPVGEKLLGRVLNGLGEPIDGLAPLEQMETRSVYSNPPNPMERKRIDEHILTGVRSIDVFAACGKGQRTGIFSGSGIGKSVLLGMIARNTTASVNVIALIGERGREVREFIEKDLGPEGLERSVVIVVTSDEPALVKIKGILIACTIAEYFRDKSMDVMLLVDSLTRIGMAQREIGLAVGEMPTSKGYTPSVFSLLPKIIERAGYNSKGSITGFYTVLVEADDMNDPIADAARSFLDGHIVLSRKIAEKQRFPAMDILQSSSRLMNEIASSEHKILAAEFRTNLAYYEESEDLINIGAYVKGNDPKIDKAIDVIDPLTEYLRQGLEDKTDMDSDLKRLAQILHFNPTEVEQVDEKVSV